MVSRLRYRPRRRAEVIAEDSNPGGSSRHVRKQPLPAAAASLTVNSAMLSMAYISTKPICVPTGMLFTRVERTHRTLDAASGV